MRQRLELQVALNNNLALFTLSLGGNSNVLRNQLTYFWGHFAGLLKSEIVSTLILLWTRALRAHVTGQIQFISIRMSKEVFVLKNAGFV